MNDKDRIVRGAEIILKKWIELQPNDKLCIVTGNSHYEEAMIIEKCARKMKARVNLLFVDEEGIHVGKYFDENPNIFQPYNVIIGASDYSIITTKAADKAIASGKKLLSLPLSTRNGKSMLGFDFIRENVNQVKKQAFPVMEMLNLCKRIRITTSSGTNLEFVMVGRQCGLFNGQFWPGHHYTSASFEICIPILENCTNGTLVCDGSLGYIGKAEEPVTIQFKNGRIVNIEDNNTGRKLKEYIESYNDSEMYVAAELGIGLNRKSRCVGECYIEDESAYGTFHIGLGRNVGLGGIHEASGHFDLVTWNPDIYLDHVQIMKSGSFLKYNFAGNSSPIHEEEKIKLVHCPNDYR